MDKKIDSEIERQIFGQKDRQLDCKLYAKVREVINYKVSKIKRLELETYLNVQELINLKYKNLI